MRQKLRTAEGRAVYKLRKAVVELVFGQKRAKRVSEIFAAGVGPRGGRMEDDLRHAQSVEALPVWMESTKRLNKPAQPAKLTSRAALREAGAQILTLGERGMARKQTSESLSPTDS
jgi:hypothetical protein